MNTKSDNNSLRIDLLILGAILIIALLLRLYKIDSPLADHHSWRQADTAAVARNFVRHGFDLTKPRYDDISNIQSGKDNPQGLRLVEFPLYNALIAWPARYLPVIPLEIYGRLVTIFFSLLTTAVIYYLVLHEESRVAAIFSAGFFAIMPFFVFYGRVVLPDMTAIALMFLSIFFGYLWANSKQKNHWHQNGILVISALLAATSILVKPTTIFYLLVPLYFMIRKYKITILTTVSVYLYIAIALSPLIAWRLWISQFPVGIPVSEWLLTSVNTPKGLENIFFRPAFFRWVFYERIAAMILGAYGLAPFIAGIIKKHRNSSLFYVIGLSSLIYLLTFQGGNVQHDYYQIMILPTLAIFVGIGLSFFLGLRKSVVSKSLVWIAMVTIVSFSFLFSYFQIKGFYDVDGGTINIAKLITTLTEPESIIVTDTVGDTTLLYLADRKGYPAVTYDLQTLKKRGANYFVTTNSEVIANNKKIYKTIFENDQVAIFKL